MIYVVNYIASYINNIYVLLYAYERIDDYTKNVANLHMNTCINMQLHNYVIAKSCRIYASKVLHVLCMYVATFQVTNFQSTKTC